MVICVEHHTPAIKKSVFYITDGTTDLANVPECKPKSEALDLTSGNLWIKRTDEKWQMFGTSTVYPVG